MPGDHSKSFDGPGDNTPYVPTWMETSPVVELYQKTLLQIARFDAAYQEDLKRIETENRERLQQRQRQHSDEVSHLHQLRCSLADQVADIEAAKPLTIIINK